MSQVGESGGLGRDPLRELGRAKGMQDSEVMVKGLGLIKVGRAARRACEQRGMGWDVL